MPPRRSAKRKTADANADADTTAPVPTDAAAAATTSAETKTKPTAATRKRVKAEAAATAAAAPTAIAEPTPPAPAPAKPVRRGRKAAAAVEDAAPPKSDEKSAAAVSAVSEASEAADEKAAAAAEKKKPAPKGKGKGKRGAKRAAAAMGDEPADADDNGTAKAEKADKQEKQSDDAGSAAGGGGGGEEEENGKAVNPNPRGKRPKKGALSDPEEFSTANDSKADIENLLAQVTPWAKELMADAEEEALKEKQRILERDLGYIASAIRVKHHRLRHLSLSANAAFLDSPEGAISKELRAKLSKARWCPIEHLTLTKTVDTPFPTAEAASAAGLKKPSTQSPGSQRKRNRTFLTASHFHSLSHP